MIRLFINFRIAIRSVPAKEKRKLYFNRVINKFQIRDKRIKNIKKVIFKRSFNAINIKVI